MELLYKLLFGECHHHIDSRTIMKQNYFFAILIRHKHKLPLYYVSSNTILASEFVYFRVFPVSHVLSEGEIIQTGVWTALTFETRE